MCLYVCMRDRSINDGRSKKPTTVSMLLNTSSLDLVPAGFAQRFFSFDAY